jgi:RND family efflux transporter MFP subunit
LLAENIPPDNWDKTMEQISHQINHPSFIKRLIPIIVVLAVVFLLMKVMSGMKSEPAKVPAKVQGFLVETATVTPTDLTLTIESQGTLQPKRQIALVTEISGKVMSLNPAFTVGGTFNTGDVLITLDPADYQVAVARADANLASAQAQLDLEQAKSDQAQKDWKSFGKQGQPSDLLLNKPQLAGAQASVKAAQADLRKAQRDLSKTEIKAPFAGTVLSKSIDLGQFVGISGQLGSIAGTEVAEVRLPLSNSDINKLNLKNLSLAENPLPVTFMGDQGQVVTSGHIKRLESSKDSRTLMNYAVAEIQQPFADNLLFNTFLQAKITGSEYTDVYAIPSAWMMPDDQIAVYAKDGTLEIKSVHVTHKTSDFFYVDQGLSSIDHIITTPIQAPEIGMQLRRADQQNEPIAIEPVAAVQATETTP